MKRLSLFSLIVLLFMINSVTAQQYYPFPTDTAKWSVYSRLSPIGSKIWDTFFYFIDGDTLIDSVAYAKIYSVIAETDEIDTLNATYLGGLREDTNKHIYFKPGVLDQDYSYQCWIQNETLGEYLLYRFDIDSGDSFYMNEYVTNPYTVESVDSMLVDSNYRKRYFIWDNDGGDIWIEGIGSETSLFGPICMVFEGAEYLLCYEDPAIFYFGMWNDSDRCTDFIVGNQKRFQPLLRLYPNPVPSNRSITIGGPMQLAITIELFDLTGKLRQRIAVEALPYNMRILVPQGVYLLSIKSNNKTYLHQKLIVN